MKPVRPAKVAVTLVGSIRGIVLLTGGNHVTDPFPPARVTEGGSTGSLTTLVGCLYVSVAEPFTPVLTFP